MWPFSRKTPTEQHAASDAVASKIAPWKANKPLPAPNDYRSLSEDGYRRNLIIYACIRYVAESLAEPDLRAKLTKGGESILLADEHKLSMLINRPNPTQGQFEFLDVMATHMQIAGTAYVHKVRSGAERVVELWLLRPDRVFPVPAANGIVTRYEYKIAEGGTADIIDAKDVIAIPYGPDPLDDYHGLSPIVAAARMGDLDNNAVDYMRSIFLNAGIPIGLLKFKTRMEKKERDRVGLDWKERYGGGVNSWNNVAVVDADVEYQGIGLEPAKLGIDPVFNQTETRLCAAFGVPPILISTAIGLERATYANYIEAKRAFWQGRLMSLFTRIADKLTVGLAQEYDPNAWLEFNLDDIEVLQESRETKRQYAINGWTAGLLTRNEARRHLGEGPVVGGDVFRAGLDSMTEEAVIDEQNERNPEIRREVQEAARELRAELVAVTGRKRAA